MDLERFVKAQKASYPQALAEVRSGRKQSHWMWYIFPQLRGLGQSETAHYYGLKNPEEAIAYLQHSVLGIRLIEITMALLNVEGLSASEIFGYPDDLKLHSSMTLFSLVDEEQTIFHQVLDKYFEGKKDQKTLQVIKK